MKTKCLARSVMLVGSCVFLFAVFLFAAANSSGLDSGAFSNASTQLNRNAASGPLGGQCVTLRGPIVTLSTSADIAFVDTAPAAFNSQADEFLIGWDQLIGM